MGTSSTEVAIIDDDHAIRADVARLLGSIGLEPTTYESAEAFLADNPGEAGCVVTEMRMAGMSGLQLQEELSGREAGVPLIMLTGFADVPAAVRSMKAGAFDFIEKPFNPQLLIETVHRALRQADEARRAREVTAEVRGRFEKLTPREREVFWLVVRGAANKTVARQLDLSEKTVEFHRSKVMAKMRAESVAELVRLSIACPKGMPAGEMLGRVVRREVAGVLADA